MKPTFFRTPAAFREWLQQHHGSAAELLVGFHKKASGARSDLVGDQREERRDAPHPYP
jgi:uncharacterized protein YdeI (YjbR/CyaY-like superfamily)